MTTYTHLPHTRWSPGTPLQQKRVTAVIPAFAYANPLSSTQTKVADYELGNLVNITLGQTFEISPRNTSFYVAVRCQNADGNTVRFVLHRPTNAAAFFWPDYNGETLTFPAVLEIWANPAEEVTYSNDDLSFVINTAHFADQNTTCFCKDLSGDFLLILEASNTADTMEPPAEGLARCAKLIEWSASYPTPIFQFRASLVDSTNVRQQADIKWPDNVTGTWTRLVKNAVFNDVDAWIVTYDATGASVYQPLVIRDVYGNIIEKPDLVCLGTAPAVTSPDAGLLSYALVFPDVATVRNSIITADFIVVRDVQGFRADYFQDISSTEPDDDGDTTIIDANDTRFTRLPGPQ